MSNGQPAVDVHLSAFLLEIGTEEIPARLFSPALAMFKETTETILTENYIEFSAIRTYATPRRLAVMVSGVPVMQKDRIKEIYGPPKNVAFDKDGSPTKAAEGFARSQGVGISDIVVKKKDKGEYVVAVIEQKGIAVRDLLPVVLKDLVLSMHFPRSMRWGSGNLRFVRPIRWIAALLDEEVISFEIDGIKSGNITKGHRFLSPGAFVIRDIPSYESLMENNYAIVSPEIRKGIIAERIKMLAMLAEGVPVLDENLLDTVTHLVEYPVPVMCDFNPGHLVLPKELLITVMKDHQKFFAVEDEMGHLKNHFIVISNTKEENSQTIKTGAERVIKARFEDARFYYEEDRKRPLNARIEDLKRVTFHDKLGTLYDKTERIAGLASSFAERLCKDSKKHAERAAWLSKADLITGVVSEFPELQGIMGRYYSLHDGEDREVADAVMEQYLPAHSGGRVPVTDAGALVSLSDKLDNIVSFFSVDFSPTGSEDPFALRRQTLGVVAILTDKGYDVTLREVITEAARNLRHSKASLIDDVLSFFLLRIEQLFLSQGHETDLIQSIMHLLGDVPLKEIKGRLDAIKMFSSRAEYNPLLLAMKRINNIIPDIQIPAFKKTLMTEEPEKLLCSDLIKAKTVIDKALESGEYLAAVKSFSALIKPVNDFFDGVLVMDKNEERKLNRLALLSEIWETALRICDFSMLMEKGNA